MPIQNIGGTFRDGQAPGNQGNQQTSQVEAAHAGPSSSTGSTRHLGHSKARGHDASYQPQRQAEQYSGRES